MTAPFDTSAPRAAPPPLHTGGGWLGVPLNVARDLRGRIVLLHFFAGSSLESARVDEELRALQRRFGEVLTVVGVHSPRMARERAPALVHDAVARTRISHPVLDDYERLNAAAYAIPGPATLVLLDHHGLFVGAPARGTGHTADLARAIEALILEGEAEDALQRDPDHGEGLLDVDLDTSGLAGDGELAFPTAVAAQLVGGEISRFAIADTGNDRVLLCRPDGQLDGVLPGYYQPQALAFDEDGSLLVCETGRDAVWRVDAAGGARTLVTDRVPAPCGIVRWGELLVVSGAARHVLLAVGDDGEVDLLAGDGEPRLRDGEAPLGASLAEPRGLAVTAAGELAFVDAQSSALRVLDRPGGTVRTLAGAGLDEWGQVDGDREQARLQLPLGVAAVGDDLYVADTYNGDLRRWRDGRLQTLPFTCFGEPAGITALPDGQLLVADRARQNVLRVDPAGGEVVSWEIGRPGALTPPELIPATVLLAPDGEVTVAVAVDLDGDVLDDAPGSPPPIQVHASAAAEWLLGEPRDWTADALPVELAIPVRRGAGRVIIETRVACGDGEVVRERRMVQAVDVIAR